MKRSYFMLFLTFSLLMPIGVASAGVFERDWKAPGDGLLTYDDVNQREWLDVTVSSLNQFPEPRLDNAVAEIATGGRFAGFTWAKRRDVIALLFPAAEPADACAGEDR